MTSSEMNVAIRGNKFLTTAAVHTVNAFCLEAREDTVLSSVKVDNVERIVDYGISGITLTQGEKLFSFGDKFTSVTITSGSLIAYLS